MSEQHHGKFKRIVWPLAIGQMLTWAGLFYLFPSLLGAWESDLGWSKTELAGALTTALLISAVTAPFVGREIDQDHAHVLFPTSTLAAAIL
ncbi:MAG: MFS transporter, partial [Rhodospirillaceae bacterium]|nr:MFS transporter [Rhodospirillaceae bacterium]